MNQKQLRKEEITLGDVGVLLSGMSLFFDMVDGPFGNHGHLADPLGEELSPGQVLTVMRELVEFFEGADRRMTVWHRAALRDLGEQFDLSPDMESGKWQRMCLAKLGTKLAVPRARQCRDWKQVKGSKGCELVEQIVQRLSSGWESWAKPVAIRRSEQSRVREQLKKKAEVLYLSGRKLRGMAIHERNGGVQVAALVQHLSGRAVLEKSFATAPTPNQVQAEIDQGLIGWECSATRWDLGETIFGPDFELLHANEDC